MHHWYEELKKTILSLSFEVSATDEATFYKVDGHHFIIIAAATDTNSRQLITSIKAQLNQHFELIELSDISWLLGVSIT